MTGAVVAEAIHLDIEPVQDRHEEVGDRRTIKVPNVVARPESASGFAGEEDGQIAVTMGVAVFDLTGEEGTSLSNEIRVPNIKVPQKPRGGGSAGSE